MESDKVTTPEVEEVGAPDLSKTGDIFNIDAYMSQADKEVATEEPTDEASKGEKEEKEESAEGSSTAGDEGAKEEKVDEARLEVIKSALKPPSAAKEVVAKAGESEIKVPKDAVFEVKIDGKKEKVSTEELLRSYSSSSHNARRDAELRRKEEALNAKDARLEESVEEWAKLVEEGKVIEAIHSFISGTGKDPLTTTRKIREALITDAREFLLMDEAQRKSLEIEEENTYLKQARDRATAKELQDRKIAEINHEISTVMEEVGVQSREEFKTWFDKTKAYLQAEVNSGIRKEIPEITPRMVGQFVDSTRQTDMLFSVIDEVDSGLRSKPEVVHNLVQILFSHRPSREELLTVVRDVYGSESEETEAPQGRATQKSAKPPIRRATSQQSKQHGTRRGAEDEEVDPGFDIDATPDITDWKSFLD